MEMSTRHGSTSRRKRLLIFIVAYNAERTLAPTLNRIPDSLLGDYDVEVLVIDDASQDRTFEAGLDVRRSTSFPFVLTVLFNPVNQGYGGNQKLGFHYAIERGFDFVALVHGDGQYAPECLPDLVQPLADGTADAVFGSRMLTRRGALRGGMPLYKFVGNRILTYCQNRLLRASLSEFHSGYRVYSVKALERIPFRLNNNAFHFDTEIIIQLLRAQQRIRELPIPTYYGDEICHVNGLQYGWDVLVASWKARIQDMSLFYDRKFDCVPPGSRDNEQYLPKLSYDSTHRVALEMIPAGSRVLDLGCAGGYMGAELRARGCYVVGVDKYPLGEGVELDEFHRHDLNDPALPVDLARFDVVLLLDVLEHLESPETFVERLQDLAASAPHVRFVASTGNVGFIVTRLMLLVGQLNYGKRGILDLTHTRLFTFRAFVRLFDQAGFEILDVHGIAAPFPLALDNKRVARLLMAANRTLIRLRRTLFAYQSLIVARARPSLPYLLRQAETTSRTRTGEPAARGELTGSTRG